MSFDQPFANALEPWLQGAHNERPGQRVAMAALGKAKLGVRHRMSSWPLSTDHLIQDPDGLAPFWLSNVAGKLPCNRRY